MPRHFKAIAAMAQNRVIGRDNKMPWHLPEELKWFRKMTLGQVVIMGRKTFESLGKPLPGRENIVLSRGPFQHPGVRTVHALEEISPANDPREHYIIGGAQLFELTLPRCSDLYLTLVKREAEGEVRFPAFEEIFQLQETVLDHPDFTILHYRNAALAGSA